MKGFKGHHPDKCWQQTKSNQIPAKCLSGEEAAWISVQLFFFIYTGSRLICESAQIMTRGGGKVIVVPRVILCQLLATT